MKLLTFRGGIHPDDKKTNTRAKKIIEIAPSAEMVYPLSQHIGAPCESLVSPGDFVLAGQKIADSKAFVSAPIHASVSGTVKAIERRRHPNGKLVESIVVENDGKNQLSPDIYPRDDFFTLSKEEKLRIIREAGIVGMGGAGFPTHVKLNPKTEVEYCIVNGAECEPYLTSDHRVMREEPETVVEGLRCIMATVPAKRGIIAIEENKQDAIEQITKACQKYDDIQVVVLRTKYPQGSEKHLIKAVTGREVPSGGLPADVGVVVNNVDTAASVFRAATLRQPLTSRVVTVSGSAIDTPRNFRVKIGTSFSDVIENAGGFIGDVGKVIMGGPMMGIAQFDLNVPVIKGTSGILAFDKSEVRPKAQSPCIRCGECVERCPMHLMPLYLNIYAGAGDYEKCLQYGIMDCIECGVCSYLCQSDRDPVKNIRLAKQEILKRKKKQ